MKRKLLILAFVAVALVTAFSFFFSVGAERVSVTPSHQQWLAFGLNRGAVVIDVRRYYGTMLPIPGVRWRGGIAWAEPDTRGGFQWGTFRDMAGTHSVKRIWFPLWPALLILAAMIYLGRRRGNRGAFPVGAPTTKVQDAAC